MSNYRPIPVISIVACKNYGANLIKELANLNHSKFTAILFEIPMFFMPSLQPSHLLPRVIAFQLLIKSKSGKMLL